MYAAASKASGQLDDSQRHCEWYMNANRVIGSPCSLPLVLPTRLPPRHPHRLSELQGVLELTDVLAALVEQYSSGAGAGGRGVLGLRPALQQLCKAALDGLHRRSLGKLTSEWHKCGCGIA